MKLSKYLPRFFLLLLSSTTSLACNSQCRKELEVTLVDRYEPIMREHFTRLKVDLLSSLAYQVDHISGFKMEIDTIVDTLLEEILDRLETSIDYAIFSKYYGTCRTEVDECPNHFCHEVCSSSGSLIYHMDDILERTRLEVIREIQDHTTFNGHFDTTIWSRVSKVLSEEYDEATLDNFHQIFLEILESFSDDIVNICTTGCFTDWSVDLKQLLLQFD